MNRHVDRLVIIALVSSITFSGCSSTTETGRSATHVYIVPGYAASPSDHWFAWLAEKLESRGIPASVVKLPAPDDPQPGEWQQALETRVSSAGEKTYFVAHSLGCIALLTSLEGLEGTLTVGGVILVSGFNDNLLNLPQLDDFRNPDIDYEKLVRLTGHRVVIAAKDDDIVPHALSHHLAESLDAEFISVEHGGHFLDSDGFGEFPLVLDELEKIIASGR